MSVEVSVLVLTYNQECSIGRTLDSLVAQECDFDFEIIVGDDGSSDSTRHVCEDYVRRYPGMVRLMPEAPNKGLVNNYFDCLEAASGLYVTDCSGDDYYPSVSRLQTHRDYLCANPDKVAVMSDWLISRGGSVSSSSAMARFKAFRNDVSGREMLELALGCGNAFPMLSAIMYRRQALMTVLRESPAMVRRPDWRCEDVPVVAALASSGSFGYIPFDAFCYEEHDGSVSNSGSPARQFDFYQGVAEAVLALSEFYDVDERVMSAALDARISYLVAMAWQDGSVPRMVRVRELVRKWPRRVPWKARLRMALMSMRMRRAAGGKA